MLSRRGYQCLKIWSRTFIQDYLGTNSGKDIGNRTFIRSCDRRNVAGLSTFWARYCNTLFSAKTKGVFEPRNHLCENHFMSFDKDSLGLKQVMPQTLSHLHLFRGLLQSESDLHGFLHLLPSSTRLRIAGHPVWHCAEHVIEINQPKKQEVTIRNDVASS